MIYHNLAVLLNNCSVRVQKFYDYIFHIRSAFCARKFFFLNYMQLSQNKVYAAEDIITCYTIENNNQISSMYEEYIEHVNPEFRDKILQNCTSLNVNDSNPCLISSEVGKNFVTLIQNDLIKNLSYVIEINPGFGLLTENLLQAGVPFVNLYEKNVNFYHDLHTLSKRFPNRFIVRKANLFQYMKMLNSATIVDINACKTSNKIPQKKWEESCMQVIGTTTTHAFLRNLIMSTVFQTGFMTYGRPIFYLALSPSVWKKYSCCNKGTTSNYVLFNILFNYQTFGTLDRRAFVPWKKKRKTKTSYNNYLLEDDHHLLFVVKFEPKPDLFKLFHGREDLIYFWHFVRHHLYKSSQRLIPALEKIIPGCGVRLIKKNYNIYTEFRNLNYNQVYELYMEIKSWPEYNESVFLLSAKDVKKTYEPYMEEGCEQE